MQNKILLSGLSGIAEAILDDSTYLNFNDSYDSISGKVDIDWMIRNSAPVPAIRKIGYYISKLI